MYKTEFQFDTLQCDPLKVEAMVRLLPETVTFAYGVGAVTLVACTEDTLIHGRTCRDIMLFAQRAGLELTSLSTGILEKPLVPTLVAVVFFDLEREVIMLRSDVEGTLTVPAVEVRGRDVNGELVARQLLKSVFALEADLTRHSLVSESLVTTAWGLRREVYYAIPVIRGALAQIGRRARVATTAMSSAQALAFFPLTTVGREALRLEEIFSLEEAHQTGVHGGPVGRAWLTVPYSVLHGALIRAEEPA